MTDTGPFGADDWWWLSFADPDQPPGRQFLGVAIVRGYGIASAVAEAHRLGVNPGGAVHAVNIPAWHVPAARYRERLLTMLDIAEAGL